MVHNTTPLRSIYLHTQLIIRPFILIFVYLWTVLKWKVKLFKFLRPSPSFSMSESPLATKGSA